MAAGLALGPSVFGTLFPAGFATLFPPGGLGGLDMLGRTGLYIFMFIVGLRTDLRVLASRIRTTAAISVASMAIPFALAVPVGAWLHHGYAGAGTPPLAFTLFFGAAVSVTAMPVLARILAERGLMESRAGALALTCACFGDLVCWALLLTVSTATRLHPVFLFFGLGLLVPRSWVGLRRMADRSEPVVAVVFLPVFFAVTGLRTHVELLDSAGLWLTALLVLAVAVLGKGGGCAVVARAAGYGTRESLTFGALMNTRGLMELVFLNVGRELGFISPALFAIMVVMALVTTAMTGPLLNRLHPVPLPEPALAR